MRMSKITLHTSEKGKLNMLRQAFLLIGFVFVVVGVVSIGAVQTNTAAPTKAIVPDKQALAVQMACIYGHVESACEVFKWLYEHPNISYRVVPRSESLSFQMACIYGHVKSACETFAREYEHSPVRYTLIPDKQALAVQIACIYGHVKAACETFARDYERTTNVIDL